MNDERESQLHERIAALEQELNETRLLELSVRRKLETTRESAIRLEQENADLRGRMIAFEESTEGAEDGS